VSFIALKSCSLSGFFFNEKSRWYSWIFAIMILWLYIFANSMLAREMLINSMNDVGTPKIANTCVSKLSNSGAITCACCLGVGDFEPHIHLFRVNQHRLG